MLNGTAAPRAKARGSVRRPPGVDGLDVDESERRGGASARGGGVVGPRQREDNTEHRFGDDAVMCLSPPRIRVLAGGVGMSRGTGGGMRLAKRLRASVIP
jgi:hypothetical protein